MSEIAEAEAALHPGANVHPGEDVADKIARTYRLPPELLARMEAFAEAQERKAPPTKVGRNDLVIYLLTYALDQLEGPEGAPDDPDRQP